MHRRTILLLFLLAALPVLGACSAIVEPRIEATRIVGEAQAEATAIIASAEEQAAASTTEEETSDDAETAEEASTDDAEVVEEALPTDIPPASSEDQIAAGEEVYQTVCAMCHGAEFEGGAGPRLIKPVLRFHNTAAGLYNYVSHYMPQHAPGSLTEQQYYNVVSYLLSYNEMIDGSVILSADTVESIDLR